MRFVQILRETQNATEKIRADLDRGLADFARKARGLLHDDDAQARLLAQQLNRRRRARKRATDDGDVTRAR